MKYLIILIVPIIYAVSTPKNSEQIENKGIINCAHMIEDDFPLYKNEGTNDWLYK